MSLPTPDLAARLATALTDPAIQADAAGCPLGLHLAWGSANSADSGHITLWAGTPGAAQLTCRASADTWALALSPVPPVGYQSFGALRRLPQALQIEGEELTWMQALPFLERLLEALRRSGATASAATASTAQVPAHLRALSHLRGEYVSLASMQDTWVYSESGGNPAAPTLLMLHTAGSDTRQWHGLMAQADLRRDWRLLGFDMPGHGRSPLPPGESNWVWRLSEQRYVDTVLRFMDANHLTRVTLMGCSMGAAISLAVPPASPDPGGPPLLFPGPNPRPGPAASESRLAADSEGKFERATNQYLGPGPP